MVKSSITGLWTIVGITSYGLKCGDGGVYTRVSYYASWISTTTASN